MGAAILTSLVERIAHLFVGEKILVRGLADRQNFPLNPDMAVVLQVLRLFFRRLPAAVSWLISKPPIDPLQRGPSWTRTHVGKEGCEIYPPHQTNFNAGAAIVCVSGRFGVVAPRDSRPPRTVFRTTAAMAVSGDLPGNTLPSLAPTAASAAAPEASAIHDRLLTALALAAPKRARAVLLPWRPLNHSQVREDFSSKVEFQHRTIITGDWQ